MRTALAAVALFVRASCAAYAVTDARPQLMADDQPLPWWDGGPAFLLASARGVRINFRGVFPLHSALRLDMQGMGWTLSPCNESAYALCSSDSGSVFPAPSPRVSDAPTRLPDGWRGLRCQRSAGKVLVSELAYDISACDVLDEGLDLLYTNGTLYFRQADLPEWEYVLSVVLCIVLTRALSFNVQNLLQPSTPVLSQAPGLAATGVILALVSRDWDLPYVTVEDLVFFYVSVAFVSIYVALYTWEYLARKMEEDSPLGALVSGQRERDTDPFFTLLIGGLQLAILRFYHTVDNPYAPILLAMLTARLWIKVRANRGPLFAQGKRSGRWALTGHVTLLLDAVYVSFYTSVASRAVGLMLVPIYVAGWIFSEVVESQQGLKMVKDDEAVRPKNDSSPRFLQPSSLHRGGARTPFP